MGQFMGSFLLYSLGNVLIPVREVNSLHLFLHCGVFHKWRLGLLRKARYGCSDGIHMQEEKLESSMWTKGDEVMNYKR